MRSSQLQYRLSHFHKMQRLWRWWKSRPSGHGALKNPISRSSWTTSLERQGFKVCFCLVRIIWLHLLRDMICGVALRKNRGWEGCHVVEEQLTITINYIGPCTEPSEGVHNWRNVKSEWWCYMIFDSDRKHVHGQEEEEKEKEKEDSEESQHQPIRSSLVTAMWFFFVSQLQKSWTRWTTTWTVARL